MVTSPRSGKEKAAAGLRNNMLSMLRLWALRIRSSKPNLWRCVPETQRRKTQRHTHKTQRYTQNPTLRVEEQRTNRSITEKQKHHASGAMKDWLSIKSVLKLQLPEVQFRLWVRPMYLLKVMERQLLLALPPNRAMMDAARTHLHMLQEQARKLGYDGCSLTRYPTDYERERLEKEYPEFYAQMFGNRKRKAQEQRPAASDIHRASAQAMGECIAEAC